MKLDFDTIEKNIEAKATFKTLGKVTKVLGLIIEADGLNVELGELCYIQNKNSRIKVEVVGFRDGITLLMPLAEADDIKMGSDVTPSGKQLSIKVGTNLIGRVIDALGNPLDGLGEIRLKEEMPQWTASPHPLERSRVSERLDFGIKAVDGLLSCGKGQRMGIFSGSGVGKSTLLGMFARNSDADLNVIALVGERGREVREFVEENLGKEGLKKSIVIVATGDQPSLLRIKAALFAHSIAEYFRDKEGKNVLLMLDSVTRIALAQREIGLAVGEPPATRGFTPSVFALLPKLLERSGTGLKGSITALYTVLVEGDDLNEPVSDTVRGVLDGHIVLSRQLAALNHFPAIDVLGSVSRVMKDLVSVEHQNKAAQIRTHMANYEQAKDLINIGAYQKGSNPNIDSAISCHDKIQKFLKQGTMEVFSYDDQIQLVDQIIS